MSRSDLRQQMPNVSAFIDDLRSTFGRECIDQQIRAGIKGEPVFYARENGHEIGTPLLVAGAHVTFPLPDMVATIVIKGEA